LGAITVALPWVFWVLIALGEANQDSFTGYYTNYVNWWSQFGAPSIGRVIAHNSMMVFLGTTNIAIGFIYYISSFLEFPIWLAMLSLLLGLISWFTVLLKNRQASLLRWFLMSYLLIIILWPWPPSRFIVPILPFIIPNLFYGILVMLQKPSFLLSSRGFIIAVYSVVLAGNLILSYHQIKLNRYTHYNQPIRWGTQVSWTAYEDIFKWIKSNSRPDDIIASGTDSMTYLYTGRRAFKPFLSNSLSLFYGMDSPGTGTVKDLSQILKTYKPRFLIHTPMPGFREEKPFKELVDKFIKKYAKSLTPAYVGTDSRFVIFEVNVNAINSPVD
jgi:hypothetical protein